MGDQSKVGLSPALAVDCFFDRRMPGSDRFALAGLVHYCFATIYLIDLWYYYPIHYFPLHLLGSGTEWLEVERTADWRGDSYCHPAVSLAVLRVAVAIDHFQAALGFVRPDRGNFDHLYFSHAYRGSFSNLLGLHSE